MNADDLSLDLRSGLPEPLRVLLADYPREGWAAHPNFRGLVEFWLDRHMMFRRILGALEADAGALADRRIEGGAYGARLARYGALFVGELHGHHHIEDAHYFPALLRSEPGLARGFDLLDGDHQALDGHLAAFAGMANGLLASARPETEAAAFLDHLEGLRRFLDRHLTDEEELIVPIILRHGERGIG